MRSGVVSTNRRRFGGVSSVTRSRVLAGVPRSLSVVPLAGKAARF